MCYHDQYTLYVVPSYILYLTFLYRAPNVINSNPGMVMPSQKFNSDDEWLSYASKIIRAAIDYKQQIDKYVDLTPCVSSVYIIYKSIYFKVVVTVIIIAFPD